MNRIMMECTSRQRCEAQGFLEWSGASRKGVGA